MQALSCIELTQGDKNLLCDLVRQTLDLAIYQAHFKPLKTPVSKLLQQKAATFVTLYSNDELRGCIGTYCADTALWKDVCDHTYSSACEDSRFLPLTEKELKNVSFNISILSELVELNNLGETQLLQDLRINIDGLMLQYKEKRAIFLPSVWQQLATEKEFVSALKRKGGWPTTYWSDELKIFTFQTLNIEADYLE
ncbi:AmmeMemoRadiSam system protein A [Pseudoalteromonas denitrificans]|uniref:AMMECR1 domain-containing protein n=1 Tax=Pseudoalteromonas denitrificans DSM 6059 TaxID=1123010 RepID=A0A1I1J543_9GAMM|nr:AmmeMemoRadiSam system protein A [Pseudoalteromonas denitrificans]SFC43221.1 hypothetical protein SAMN02745724_01646 [Pseudoalteromonas denitrificans DSM 6059]